MKDKIFLELLDKVINLPKEDFKEIKINDLLKILKECNKRLSKAV